jgi:hypothetical protein
MLKSRRRLLIVIRWVWSTWIRVTSFIFPLSYVLSFSMVGVVQCVVHVELTADSVSIFRCMVINEITVIEGIRKTLTCARLRFSRRWLWGYCLMGCDSVCSELLHTNLIFIPCIMLNTPFYYQHMNTNCINLQVVLKNKPSYLFQR